MASDLYRNCLRLFDVSLLIIKSHHECQNMFPIIVSQTLGGCGSGGP